MNKIQIFTDGACVNNGKKNALAGYGIHFPNNEYEGISKPFLIKPITNQRAELYAIHEALTIVSNEINKTIEIYTDSQYSIDCFTKWINRWEINNWKSRDGKIIKNLDIIKPIYKLIKQNNVIFYHVRSHTGKNDFNSIHNDIADKLATSGINRENKQYNNTLSKYNYTSNKQYNNTSTYCDNTLEQSINFTNNILKKKKNCFNYVNIKKLTVNFDVDNIFNKKTKTLKELFTN